MRLEAKPKAHKPQDPIGIVESALRLNERMHQDLESALELLRDDRQRALVVNAPAGVPGNDLIAPKAVAGMLGCDVRTLRRWTREGRVPVPLQIGRVVRWRRAEIEALVP